MKKFIDRGMRHCAGRTGRETERRSIVRRVRAFCFGHEDGNSLVEFALTLPILMTVLMAIFEFGIAFNNQLQLTQAVGLGARYLQTARTSTTDPCKDTMTAITNATSNLVPANIKLTLTMSGNASVSGSTCSGDQSQLVSGQPTTVYATYPCNIALYGFKFSSTCNLTAQVTEYEN